MQGFGNGSWLAGMVLTATLVVAGCAAPSRPAAPVEDRGTMIGAPGASAVSPGAPMLTTDPYGKPLPGSDSWSKFLEEVDALRDELAQLRTVAPAPAVQAALSAVRQEIAFLHRDRALDGDVQAAVRMEREGKVLAAVKAQVTGGP